MPGKYTEFDVKQGATFILVFKIESDPDNLVTGAEAVTCIGKAMSSNRGNTPEDSDPTAFTMTPSFTAADVDGPDRWYFTLSATDSGNLDPGYYYVESTIPLSNGYVSKPTPFVIHIER